MIEENIYVVETLGNGIVGLSGWLITGKELIITSTPPICLKNIELPDSESIASVPKVSLRLSTSASPGYCGVN